MKRAFLSVFALLFAALSILYAAPVFALSGMTPADEPPLVFGVGGFPCPLRDPQYIAAMTAGSGELFSGIKAVSVRRPALPV